MAKRLLNLLLIPLLAVVTMQTATAQLSLSQKDDGSRTFIMPDYDVEVNPTLLDITINPLTVTQLPYTGSAQVPEITATAGTGTDAIAIPASDCEPVFPEGTNTTTAGQKTITAVKVKNNGGGYATIPLSEPYVYEIEPCFTVTYAKTNGEEVTFGCGAFEEAFAIVEEDMDNTKPILIQLINDFNGGSTRKNITIGAGWRYLIDLKSEGQTMSGAYNITINNGDLIIIGDNEKTNLMAQISVENGASLIIDGGKYTNGDVCVIFSEGAQGFISDGEFESEGNSAISVIGNAGDVKLSGGHFIGSNPYSAITNEKQDNGEASGTTSVLSSNYTFVNHDYPIKEVYSDGNLKEYIGDMAYSVNDVYVKRLIDKASIESHISKTKVFNCDHYANSTEGKKLDGGDESYIDVEIEEDGQTATVRIPIMAEFSYDDGHIHGALVNEEDMFMSVTIPTDKQILIKKEGDNDFSVDDNYVAEGYLLMEGCSITPLTLTSDNFQPTWESILEQGNIFTYTKEYDGESTMEFEASEGSDFPYFWAQVSGLPEGCDYENTPLLIKTYHFFSILLHDIIIPQLFKILTIMNISYIL